MTAFKALTRLAAIALIPLAVVATSFAQVPASKSKTAGDDAPAKVKDAADRARPPITLFGDSQRFSRMGGWGGMGGTMAQFGLTKAMLVMMPGVQKELKVTDEQKDKLKEWSETFRKKGEEMAKSAGMTPGGGGAPGAGGAPGQGPGGGAPDVATIGAQIFKMMNFMSTLNGFFKEAEDAANKILTKPQRTRLNQIALQMEGLSALGREDIAVALNIDPQKYEMIQQILADVRSGQMRYWVGQITTMAVSNRGNFRRPGPNGERGPGGPPQGREPGENRQPDFGRNRIDAARKTGDAPQAETKKDETAKDKEKTRDQPLDPVEEEKQKAAREARRVEMRKRFDQMQMGSDQIQNAAMTQILKLLSNKQKAAFDRMLGEPFDPNALIEAPKPKETAAKDAKSQSATTAPDKPRPPTLRERRFGKAAAPTAP